MMTLILSYDRDTRWLSYESVRVPASKTYIYKCHHDTFSVSSNDEIHVLYPTESIFWNLFLKSDFTPILICMITVPDL